MQLSVETEAGTTYSETNESDSQNELSTDIESEFLEENESSSELEGTEKNSNVGLAGTTNGILFTSVELSILDTQDDNYEAHVSIKIPDGDSVVSGYCRASRTGEYLYNGELSDTELDFDIDKSVVGNVYFVVESMSGISSIKENK